MAAWPGDSSILSRGRGWGLQQPLQTVGQWARNLLVHSAACVFAREMLFCRLIGAFDRES